jgi:hypothetical protein
MKLDPGMHIGLHLVFFGKTGVTLRLPFLATMWPSLDPAGHRVPRVRPTCLSTPRRPRKA